MAVRAADGGWGLVVMLLLLLLLLLLVRTRLDGRSALQLFTAGGFLHHRTAVLLRRYTRWRYIVILKNSIVRILPVARETSTTCYKEQLFLLFSYFVG